MYPACICESRGSVDFRNRLTPNSLATVIRNYLSRLIPDEYVVHKRKGDETYPGRSLRDRIAFAMILVLYAVRDITLLPEKMTMHMGGQTDKSFCRDGSMQVSLCISPGSPVSHTCHHLS
jgi:hypothetical protein